MTRPVVPYHERSSQRNKSDMPECERPHTVPCGKVRLFEIASSLDADGSSPVWAAHPASSANEATEETRTDANRERNAMTSLPCETRDCVGDGVRACPRMRASER